MTRPDVVSVVQNNCGAAGVVGVVGVLGVVVGGIVGGGSVGGSSASALLLTMPVAGMAANAVAACNNLRRLISGLKGSDLLIVSLRRGWYYVRAAR
jgi:hypothetical protein